jgi:hypothetical protein
MSKSGAAPAPPLTRKQLSRAARERRQRQYITIGALVVVSLVVGVIALGLVDQTLLRPRQVVARAGDEQITKGEFIKAARFQRYQLILQLQQIAQAMQLFGQQEFFTNQLTQIQASLSDPATLGRDVINSLIDNRLIRAEAARRGINVSPPEIDKAFQEFFGFFPEGTPTPTITLTPSRGPYPGGHADRRAHPNANGDLGANADAYAHRDQHGRAQPHGHGHRHAAPHGHALHHPGLRQRRRHL